MKKWLAMATLLAGCSGSRPDGIGTIESAKKKCPDTPNCVSSYYENDKNHYLKPLKQMTIQDFDKVKTIIKDFENSEVILEEPKYIYAEFTSSIMKFVDDVEFYYNELDQEIHFRSASRIGKSDLGANKERIKSIIKKMQEN